MHREEEVRCGKRGLLSIQVEIGSHEGVSQGLCVEGDQEMEDISLREANREWEGSGAVKGNTDGAAGEVRVD